MIPVRLVRRSGESKIRSGPNRLIGTKGSGKLTKIEIVSLHRTVNDIGNGAGVTQRPGENLDCVEISEAMRDSERDDIVYVYNEQAGSWDDVEVISI